MRTDLYEIVKLAADTVPLATVEAETIAWLKARRDNCLRIAKQKAGEDQMGWLEDATYFEQAIRLLRAGWRRSPC